MKEYKVIDAILFSGEMEMLKMRLDYLYSHVDYFIICEGNTTFTGIKKNLTLLKYFPQIEKYRDKIHYVIYEPIDSDLKEIKNDKFYLEKKQRDYMYDKIKELSDENTLILLSDVDEFPKVEKFDEAWDKTKNQTMDATSFMFKTFYYSPICEVLIEWFGTTAINDKTLRTLTNFSQVREYRYNCKHIEDGGYHFSFFNSPEEIKEKIISFSHQEFNLPEYTDINIIKDNMYNGRDLFDRSEIKMKKHDSIPDFFPMEFYRHEIFFKNTFDRQYLRPMMAYRKTQSMQIPLEIENLQLEVANHNPKIIMEIGTARGGTLARWFELPSSEIIFSIDYPTGPHGGHGFEERVYVISDALEQANLHNKQFFAINGNSQDNYLIGRVRELLNGRKVDFLFIDGDHSYEGSKNDFNVYKEFLHENSIVAFHDVIASEYHAEWNCFVSTLWTDLSQKYESKEFIHTKLIDKEINEYFYNAAKHKGGFAGIGVLEYGKTKKTQKELSKYPPLSLVVPVYGNSKLTMEMLEKTLSSSTAINELILYSNGSSDQDNKILEKFIKDNPFNISNAVIYKVPEGIGFVKAVNECFKLAKNEFILCMNSDAGLFSNWEDLLLPLLENDKYGLIGPVKSNEFILGCCFIARKSVLNKIGLLNEGFDKGYVDDMELSYRVELNGYELGYYAYKDDLGESQYIDFPIVHLQGISFSLLDKDETKKSMEENKLKFKKYKECDTITLLNDLEYDRLKEIINDDKFIYIAINKSGENFEKIRYDKEILKKINLFECTPEMEISDLITSLTIGKKVNIITSDGKEIKTFPKKNKLTWLAKYDDYASMGILSQRILENLNETDISCKSIIGATETDNPLIHISLAKPKNHDLGIMFSYPDMISELSEFNNKVIYTGVDTTGGIPNFANNCNLADYILTPSNRSKERMIKLGVKKPIYVFPHGIDPEKFKYTPRIKGEKFKFLYVGECSDRKGIFQLLEAFTKLYGTNENVELHLKSNDGMVFYDGERVKEYVDKYKNIFWHVSNEGHNKVLELYKECHVYVYPSRADTFGMTVLEAMACGLPVITTSEPGVCELIKGKYYEIPYKLVPVKNHPWMLGEWAEPEINTLTNCMMALYESYDKTIETGYLKEFSDFVRTNYSWKKIVNEFETNVLPNLIKKPKIITLLTSFNRPHHIKNVINSLKDIKNENYINDVYIVENSNPEMKEEILKVINENIDDRFTVYNSDFNMGQRGALLQMLEDVNIDEYDFIQFTDQDNLFNEPLSTYCNILNENQEIFFTTGYMSKEHEELGWRNTRFGNLCEKRSLRAGHMFMRVRDLKSLFPLHLDAHYGESYNSSWNAGLDWELSWWNKNSPGKNNDNNFVLCVPGGVLHVGVDSTIYNWDVNACEYPLEELTKLRENPNA